MSDITTASEGIDRFQVRVLLVDDQLIIVEAIRRMLSGAPSIEFHYTTDSKAAVEMALRVQPSVILQDLVMPEIDGFGLIALYREHPQLSQVPVMVLSAKEDAQVRSHSFALGACDYIAKMPDRLELLARLRYHSASYSIRLQRDEARRQLAEARAELQALRARA